MRATLQEHPKGCIVLEEYTKHQTLSSEKRQALVRIAVARLMEDCGK